MGLIKRQLLKVIQWEDSSQNTLVHKFEYDDRYNNENDIIKICFLIVKECP